MKSYEDLFAERGRSYDKAMKEFPHARAEEFLNISNRIKFNSELRLLDIPAGGGYLKQYLDPRCNYYGHEPCPEFDSEFSSHSSSGLLVPTPFCDSTFDVICSLAGLHHVVDKQALFTELHRVSKPDGQLIVCDVAENSAVARFLDQFVANHNSTGHEGLYLNNQTEEDLTSTGWVLLESDKTPLRWRFDNQQAMVQFCTQLFDVQTSDRHATLKALQDYLGFEQGKDSQVELCWKLHTIVARKASE